MIELVPHDPRWAQHYDVAAAAIRDALGATALSVHHVGSTAIPGIVAKPALDILVLVETYDPDATYRDPLASLGYAFDHRDERHVFLVGTSEGIAVHVHVIEETGKDARAMITFRDHLRTHPDEARRYEEPKIELASRHGDIDAYADAKSSYVLAVVRRAGSTDVPVTLRPITPANEAAVRALAVAPGQELLIDSAGKSLDEAAASPDARPWYRAIYAGEQVVGFVMLSYDVPPGHRDYPWRYSGPGAPRAFYRGLGFEPIGERFDGEDVYRLRLDPDPEDNAPRSTDVE